MTSTRSRHETVTPLRAVGRADLASAGGKGANLGELVRNGFAVPDGFVVTTAGYASVVEQAGLATAIAAGLAEDDDGSAAREEFDAATVPDALQAAIVEAYADLGGGPVAVRSSATAEDLPGAAFAGQQDTYLHVIGEDALLDAVRRCWGSLWTERAITYRRRMGIDSTGARIAVVVQRMVAAEFAGVMFTANPVTGERDEVLVDASSGLGEAVVSGLVTPDHYVLDAGGRVRERKAGRREIVIRGAAAGGVTRTADEAAEELPDAVLAELAGVGRAVARHFGRPQDIEWAYADGRIWLLQARPMTAVPPPPLRLNRIQRISGPQIVEMLPSRPYPLDMSSWILPGPGRMVSRMLAEVPGLRVDFAEMLPESDGVVDRFVPPVPRPTASVLTAPARILPRIRRFDPAVWTSDPRFARFQRSVRELAERDPGTLEWAELRWLPRRVLDVMEAIADLRVDYLPRVGADLLRLRVLLKLLGLIELFPVLILGAPTRTEDANRALVDLAALVRADPGLRAAFTGLDPTALADRVAQDPAFDDFRAALAGFLDEYGHRETASPLLMSAPTWSEAPATVLGMVKVLVEDPRPGSAAGSRADAAVRRLVEHRLVRLTRLGEAVLHAVDAARTGIAFREDTHFYGTRTLPVLRGALLEMGRRLSDAGVLCEQADVLHLRLEELEATADPAMLDEPDVDRLRAIVHVRSARRAELAGVPLITAAVLFPAASTRSGGLVAGIPASGGRATGPVRIIRDPAEFGRLRSGDVLVCPYTNPAWTPLFQRAAAVVVDSGGLGSHAAIVAREYGIPAVMGSATGTTVLTDGQLVIVDGDAGQVTAGEQGDSYDRAGSRVP